ncbi:phosphatase PAP2 family protein [Rubrolithibacter danxiaensis]|uniref:phosphatase PAP2 family protein n=1 Tax=Rubrolithibacter danxiaensis TaxID=3390805 RepID=UPI003BF83708
MFNFNDRLKTRKVIRWLMALALLLFALLTTFIIIYPTAFFDLEFTEEVQEQRNPALDILMKGISWFGYMPVSLITVLLTALVFFLLKYKRESLFIVLTLLSGAVNQTIKVLVNRPRPTEDVVQIIEKANHQSFPSGHVVFYVVFFGFVTLLMYSKNKLKKWVRILVAGLSLFLIVTVPLSRVYLGAHWFTDVTAGFLVGFILLTILGSFYFKTKKTS